MSEPPEQTASPRRRRPRAKNGSRSSAANALTHGLTSRVLCGRDATKIEEIAGAFLGIAPRTPAAWEAACRAAEAHVDVLRCDIATLHLMRAAEVDVETFAAESASDRKVELALLKRGWAGRAVSGFATQDLIYRKYRGPPRNTTRRHVILYGKLAPRLQVLGRYAAAARARRRQAIDTLDRVLGAGG